VNKTIAQKWIGGFYALLVQVDPLQEEYRAFTDGTYASLLDCVSMVAQENIDTIDWGQWSSSEIETLCDDIRKDAFDDCRGFADDKRRVERFYLSSLALALAELPDDLGDDPTARSFRKAIAVLRGCVGALVDDAEDLSRLPPEARGFVDRWRSRSELA
jgi:hypothetical protein